MAKELTQAAIGKLELPAKGQIRVADGRVPYLYLYLTKTRRTWYYWRRWKGWGGKARQCKLGSWPELPLAAARHLAEQWSGQLALGQDPMAEPEEAEAAPTLAGLWERYWREQLVPHAKAESSKSPGVWRNHLAGWGGGRAAVEISQEEVRALHLAIGEDSGRHMANRVVQLLKAIYNHAGLPNPARGVRLFRERSRERFLAPEEVRTFLQYLEGHPGDMADFFGMLLWTGARRGNVQRMQWEQLDLAGGVWRIPGEQAKGGEPLVLPLAEPALAILRRRRERAGRGEYVFPGRKGAKRPYLQEPKKAWATLLAETGLADLRMHDLRRTLGSWQAAGGASLAVIGKSLGHRSQAATQVYARLDLEPVRASVEAAAAAMLAAGKFGESERNL